MAHQRTEWRDYNTEGERMPIPGWGPGKNPGPGSERLNLEGLAPKLRDDLMGKPAKRGEIPVRDHPEKNV